MRVIGGLFGNKKANADRSHAEKVSRVPAICSVGGGKGGVGKSFIASNLAVALSSRGHRILLLDADLGAANVHTFFDMDPERSLSRFLKGLSRLEDTISSTGINGLDIISGSRDSLDIANAHETKIAALGNALKELDYDYILVDTSPGTSNTAIDLFLLGDAGVLVVLPEPTSVENTYRYIKCLLLRKIKKAHEATDGTKLKGFLYRVLNNRNSKAFSIATLLEEVQKLDEESGLMLREAMGEKKLHIVVNQADAPADRLLGKAMQKACLDFFGLDITPVGSISHDMGVRESIRSKSPFILEYAASEAAKSLKEIAEIISGSAKGIPCGVKTVL